MFGIDAISMLNLYHDLSEKSRFIQHNSPIVELPWLGHWQHPTTSSADVDALGSRLEEEPDTREVRAAGGGGLCAEQHHRRVDLSGRRSLQRLGRIIPVSRARPSRMTLGQGGGLPLGWV